MGSTRHKGAGGLADVRRDLESAVAEDAAPGVGRSVIEVLAGGLGALVATHRPELTAGGWSTELFESSDDPRLLRLEELTRAFLPTAPLRYGHYDPLLVESDQRNRVVSDAELRARAPSPIIREVYEPAGIAALPHIRVLVTDGPFMLTWLGLWREEPFTAEEEDVVASVVPGLVTRLSVERLLWVGTPGSFDAVGQTLELVGRPAFVVNTTGQLVFVNGAARAQIDGDRSIVEDVTEAAVGSGRSLRIHSVTRVGSPGVHGHFIVLTAQTELAGLARLEAVVRDHQLTDTQARVLALLVRGDANKDIATKLRCAPRTVELHVTAILKKCRLESRARLIAWFWTHL